MVENPPSMTFAEFAAAVRKSRGEVVIDSDLTFLALDPGITTGYAVLRNDELVDFGQHRDETIPGACAFINTLMDKWNPQVVIAEDYRVYSWKQKQHAWSNLHTSQLLGAIELIVSLRTIHFEKYPASAAKGFCTDMRLADWGYYKKGLRHARDAIRHACYYALFGDRSQWQTNPTPRTNAPKAKASKSKSTRHRVG